MNNKLRDKLFSEVSILRLERKNLLLDNKYDIDTFMLIRITIVLSIFILMVIISDIGLVLGIILGSLFYFLWEYLIFDIEIIKSEKKVNLEAIDKVELILDNLKNHYNLRDALSLSITNGKFLDKVIRDIIRDLEVGRELKIALSNNTKRISSQVVRNIFNSMDDSEIYGTDLISSLEVQLNYLKKHVENSEILTGRRKLIEVIIISLLMISVISFILLYKGLV